MDIETGIQKETIARKKTGNSEQKRCSLCGKNHDPIICDFFIGLDAASRNSIGEKYFSKIREKGIIGLDNDALQVLLNQLDRNKIISGMAAHYGIAKEVKSKDGEIVGWEGMIVQRKSPDGKMERIKIDNKPITYDNDVRENTLRYHLVSEDGKIDPVVRKDKIDSLVKII